MPETFSPDDEQLLREATTLTLSSLPGAGRRKGTTELRFALQERLVLLLAFPPRKSLLPWYRHPEWGGRVRVDVGDRSYLGVLEPAGAGDLDLSDVLTLFREKYGMQLVKVWYEGRPCEPVVIRLAGSLPRA